jgi:predicted nucleotidyltransferase
MSNHTNIVRIKAVANILNQLNEEFVFVGGATVSLYGDASKSEARPTEDVDVIIELASYTGYGNI